MVSESALQIEPQDDKQPKTAKDNFAGWRFGADLFIGAAPIPEYDVYGGAHYPLRHKRQYVWYPAGGLLLEIGHLWGNQVFVGPTLNITLGYPYIAGADLRVKSAIAITTADAITVSIGYGMAWGDIGKTDYTAVEISREDSTPHDKELDDIIRAMYLPVSMGFEHVYNNGFVLGASVEMRVSFKVKETHYYYYDRSNPNAPEDYENWKDDVKRNKVVPIVGMVTAGLHLGYKF